MISPTYFNQKISLTLILFSTFLSLLFCLLVWVGIEKSDDNARNSLLASHAERFIQYYHESNKLWEKNQLTGMEVLVEGRDTIPEELSHLSSGYYEYGQEDLYVYVSRINNKPSNEEIRFYLVHQGAASDWAEQYEPIIIVVLGSVALLVIIIGSTVGLFLSKKLSEPLQILTSRIKSTDPNALEFTPLETNDEFGEISQVFANTLSRINDVLEREKQFSRYASHELRTPVAIINSSINLWKACEDDTNVEQAESIKLRAIERISVATTQMEDVIQTFLLLGKDSIDWDEGVSIPLDILLDSLIEKYQYLHSAQNIHVNKLYKKFDNKIGNHRAVSLVLSNVLRNAFDYCESKIDIELSDHKLSITNDIDTLRIEDADHFGFGLKIIEDLCHLLNWQVTYKNEIKGIFTIQLYFDKVS